MSETVYIGIGSNLGDRKTNCLKAIELLIENGVEVLKQSSMYETEPWGMENQPDFINMAVEAKTMLSPRDLLNLLKTIERNMGRSYVDPASHRPIGRWGPRIIDLDILLYDGLTIAEPDLIIPHPLMQERDFVLKPLSEIAPDLVNSFLRNRQRP